MRYLLVHRWGTCDFAVGSSSAAVLQDQEEHETSADTPEDTNHDPQFEPIVSLPEQDVKTLEEDEEELFKM